MECAGDNIISPLLIGMVIAPSFNDVNLSRSGPIAVGVVHRQHPYCGPQPIPGWQRCGDFHTAVFDGRTFLRADTTGSNGLDDGAVSGIGRRNTVMPEIR